MVNESGNLFKSEGKVSYSDRCRLLNQKGIVLWFTGLSGSGKSTIAIELENALLKKSKLSYRLDGDNIRFGLNKDLGFSDNDRDENIRRIAEVANLFKDAGIIVLVSFITPFKKMRALAKNIIGDNNFFEIFVKANIDTCKKRDPKGLYKKANENKIDNFTGITSPYEEPDNPDILIDTDKMNIEESVNYILSFIDNKLNG